MTDIFIDHPRPANAPDAAVLVGFALPRREGDERRFVERLWCRPLDDGGYEVLSIPYHVPAVTVGAVVASLDPTPSGAITHHTVRTPSSHARFGARLLGDVLDESERTLTDALRAAGATFEKHADGLFTIDAPEGAPTTATFALLNECRKAGTLAFAVDVAPTIYFHAPLAAPHGTGYHVYAPLIERDAPLRWERLSAVRIDRLRYRIADIPILAYNIAVDDEVEVAPEAIDLALTPIERIALVGLRSVVRVRPVRPTTDTFLRLTERIAELGGTTEHGRNLAIDVPGAGFHQLIAYLTVESERGTLLWEYGLWNGPKPLSRPNLDSRRLAEH